MAAPQNCTHGLPRPGSEVTEMAVVSCALAGVFVVNLACNLLTFFLTLGRESKSRFHTIFIANLALTDCLSGLILPAQWLARFVLTDCRQRHAVRLAFEASQTLCVLSVVAISVDRACVALWPVRYYKRSHRVAPWLILAALWLFGGGLHLVVFLLAPNTAHLSDAEHYASVGLLATTGVEFLLPLGALLASNIIINVKVSKGRTMRRSLPASVSRSGGSDNPGPDSSQRPLLASRRMSTPAFNQDAALAARAASRDRRASSVAMAAQALRDFRRRRMSALPSDSQRLRDQEEFIRHVFHKKQYRTLKILVIVVLIFVVCRLPRVLLFALLRAGLLDGLSPAATHRAIFYLNLLLQINASLDPIVYSFWGNRLYKRQVRGRCADLLRRLRRLAPGRTNPTWL